MTKATRCPLPSLGRRCLRRDPGKRESLLLPVIPWRWDNFQGSDPLRRWTTTRPGLRPKKAVCPSSPMVSLNSTSPCVGIFVPASVTQAKPTRHLDSCGAGSDAKLSPGSTTLLPVLFHLGASEPGAAIVAKAAAVSSIRGLAEAGLPPPQ